MATCDFPDIQFVKAAGDGGPRPASQIVVIHLTDNTASDEAEAGYASWRPDQTSAHFYNDEDSIIQAVPLSDIAYGCYPHGNRISIQFELVGREGAVPDATMRRAAAIVRRVCDRYGIPVRKIGPSEVRNGVRGICGHADVTLAFPEDGGDHMDPGPNFPWATFLGYVSGGDDMSQQSDDILAAWSVGVDHYTNPDGTTGTVEPVKWRVRDESFQSKVLGTLADLAAKVATPQPVQVDATAVASALAANTDFVKAIAKAVNDDVEARMAA